ncbi:cobalt-precorrin 5A hydrolase [Desulfovibrio sp. OttesenSCG-928-O18]|nr:cobalt-precorrin 5A hydrolase [Desulfovibrio sp. OttesenSCG-928-O18]
MSKTATAIYVLTQQGAITAAKLAASMDVDLYVPPSLGPIDGAKPFDSLRALVAKTFSAYRQHIFIAAAGVAVRCIAPHLRDKSIDPAIVVLDHHGRNVISLLSGHLGGANKLAQDVAEILGGQAVITTATDTENLPSLDILALEFNMAIANVRAVVQVNSALLAGRPVVVNDPHNDLQLRGSAWEEFFVFTDSEAYAALSSDEKSTLARVTVTPALDGPTDMNLVLHPKVLHVGIGCRRGARAEEILDLIATSLAQLELSVGAIASIASVDIKQNEQGLLDTAAELNVPLRFFSAKELDAVPVSNPSPKAQEVLGVDGVCEPAAMLAAGENARLRMPKLARRGITISIAQEAASHG